MNTSKHYSRRRSSIASIDAFDEIAEGLEMFIPKGANKDIEHDLDNKARERQIAIWQEVFNALSMLPGPLFGLYFILMGKWLTDSNMNILQAMENLKDLKGGMIDHGGPPSDYTYFPFDYDQCIFSSILPHLHALPPVPTLAIVIGIILHTPCSICYHLQCAYKLPAGPDRLNHWSRRLDQSMIHCMSLLNCYGNSGSVDYTLYALVFTLDSINLLIKNRPGHQPLIRLIPAFILPILPLFTNGHWMEAMLLSFIYCVSGWLYLVYPFGGWSHGIFHLVCFFSIPVTLSVSTKLVASEDALQIAAGCAAMLKTAST